MAYDFQASSESFEESEEIVALIDEIEEDSLVANTEIPKEEKELSAKQKDQVVIENLKGIVLVGRPEDLQSGGNNYAAGVQILDIDIPGNEKDLQAKLTKYIGKAVTLNDLDRMKKDILKYFKQTDILLLRFRFRNKMLPMELFKF